MVQWRNTEAYRYIQSQDSTTYVADQNILANPCGKHTILGVILSQALPQLLCGGLEMIDSGELGIFNNKTENTEDETYVQNQTSSIRKFRQSKDNFYKALEDLNNPDGTKSEKAKENAEKYLKEMEDYIKTNDNKTYRDVYNQCKAELEKK